jgi:homoserine O-acetyltransferase
MAVPDDTTAHVSASARLETDAPGVTVREGVAEWAGPWTLHHGGALPSLRLAWRLVGPEHAPVVAVLGGISAHRRVAAEDDGWWAPLVGRGRALDGARFRVLGIDFVGGSGASTGPQRGGPRFPSIGSRDQADALERLLVISGADRAHPLSTAWRSVQREIVRFGVRQGDAAGGLKLARALAMATYRSPDEFVARFSGPPRETPDGFRFPVEDYLHARGDAYAAQYVPEAFVCLSESIDLHTVDATRVPVPTTLVAVREDQLVPLAHMQELAARLPRARLHVISSLYGHDAFLKEDVQLRPIFADCLEGSDR